jgi:hypothetical protein
LLRLRYLQNYPDHLESCARDHFGRAKILSLALKSKIRQ